MTVPNDGSFQWRSCSKKRKYGTQTLAEEVAASWLKKQGRRLYTYACRFCGWWHLTHMKQDHRNRLLRSENGTGGDARPHVNHTEGSPPHARDPLVRR